MNVRFSAPTDGITAPQTSCGSITVTEESQNDPQPDPDPSPPDGLPIGDAALLGGAGLLALIVVALLVI